MRVFVYIHTNDLTSTVCGTVVTVCARGRSLVIALGSGLTACCQHDMSDLGPLSNGRPSCYHSSQLYYEPLTPSTDLSNWPYLSHSAWGTYVDT